MTKVPIFPIFLLVAGVITIIEGLTKSYLMNEGEGPPTKAEIEEYKTTPRRRIAAVAMGLILLLWGVGWIFKGQWLTR